ncbi:hypothetical protein GMMP13_1120004 [Candidatus Magnetomoraceae bacterium gMMP-13]
MKYHAAKEPVSEGNMIPNRKNEKGLVIFNELSISSGIGIPDNLEVKYIKKPIHIEKALIAFSFSRLEDLRCSFFSITKFKRK